MNENVFHCDVTFRGYHYYPETHFYESYPFPEIDDLSMFILDLKAHQALLKYQERLKQVIQKSTATVNPDEESEETICLMAEVNAARQLGDLCEDYRKRNSELYNQSIELKKELAEKTTVVEQLLTKNTQAELELKQTQSKSAEEMGTLKLKLTELQTQFEALQSTPFAQENIMLKAENTNLLDKLHIQEQKNVSEKSSMTKRGFMSLF